MAVLQYRPTDAPDFSTALRGLQLFGDQWTQGIGAAQRTLAGIQAQQQQGADQELLTRALRLQSADGLSAALADGSLLQGINPSRISTQTLGGLQDRVGTMLNQDRTRQALEQGALGLETGRYAFGRTQDMDARSDAARSASAQLIDAAARGNTAAVNRIRSENAGVFGNLNAEQALSLAQGSQGLLRGELGQRAGEFGLSRDRTMFANSQTDRAEGRAADELVSRVMQSSMSADDAAAAIGRSNASDQVKAQALGRVNSAFPGAFGSLPQSRPGTAGTANGNPFDVVVGGGAFGNSPTPITSMTMGDAVKFGQEVLIPGTRNNAQLGLSGGKGSSAMGAYQITQSTLQDYGPKVLGKDWASQPMSAENQDKIAKAIFEERKNGNLKDTWTSLPNATPGAYKDFSWESIRGLISKGESGTDVNQMFAAQRPSAADLRAGSNAAILSSGVRQMQDMSGGNISADYARTMADNRDLPTVVNELMEGPLKGTNRAEVIRQMTNIMQESGGNAATAGAILSRNTAGTNRWTSGSTGSRALDFALTPGRMLLDAVTGNNPIGGGFNVNQDGIRTQIEAVRNGSALNQASTVMQGEAARAQLAGASQALQEAQQERATFMARAATRPDMLANRDRYDEKVARAQQRLEMILRMQQSLPNANAIQDRTAPLAPSEPGFFLRALSEGIANPNRTLATDVPF